MGEHCGICAESICYFKVWNFQRSIQRPPPLPAYQVNHTYSLSHFPSFSFSPSLSHVCIYSCTYTAWPLTFAEHKQGLHVWQVLTVLLDCCCMEQTVLSFSALFFLSVRTICPSLLCSSVTVLSPCNQHHLTVLGLCGVLVFIYQQ